jgi:hypothetical protein
VLLGSLSFVNPVASPFLYRLSNLTGEAVIAVSVALLWQSHREYFSSFFNLPKAGIAIALRSSQRLKSVA